VALPKVSLALVAACLLSAAGTGVASAQTITIDGRLPGVPAQTLIGPNYNIGANLGKQVGSNLFHSFGQFNLVKGDTAAFSGPATINNVIGRVTGGIRSDIDGKIQSNIAGANLFLINPSGIVFGPNATVNVSGAFHASTADYIKMADGAKFQATHPDGSTLSAAPPAAFGFLTASPPAISVNGSQLNVLPGQTLGFVGGPVSITAASPIATTGATLSAPAGTIHVASAASTGEVPVDPRNTSAMTVSKFGPVAINGRSKFNVSDPKDLGSGGSVFVRSGTLAIDASEINADNYGGGPGGQLMLQADSKVVLSNKAKAHALARASGTSGDIDLRTSQTGVISLDNSTVKVGSSASGDGGALSVTSGQITLTNGAALKSNSKARGNGGTISISADAIVLDGGAVLDQSTGIFSISSGSGNGGSITIVAGQLALHNGANVLVQSSAAGAGGALDVKVNGPLTVDSRAALKSDAQGTGGGGPITVTADAILLDGDAVVDQSTKLFTMFSEIFSSTSGGGRGGSITIIAGELSLHNGAGVLAQNSGAGAGGALDVKVNGPLTVNSGASLGTTASGDGNAGDVSVMVSGPVTIDMSVGADPSILDGIGSLTNSRGNAGNVIVNAGSLSIAQRGGIFSQVTKESSGTAGTITVSAGSLSIRDNGFISSVTFGQGDAGGISVRVAGALTIDGTMADRQFATGITADADPGALGNAGAVSVTAGSLSMTNQGEIASNTFGRGDGGAVIVNVVGELTIDGAMTPVFTGIASQADVGLTGNAGAVTVNAGGAIALFGGGRVSTATFGAGDSGTIRVTAQGALTLSGPATGIFASAEPDSSGNAGSVFAAAPRIALTSGAGITSITAGTGGGGSVTVTTPGALLLDGGGDPNTRISTSATGPQSGQGGKVAVEAGSLTIQGGAQIASTTAGPGKGGDVNVKVASDIMLPDGGPQITAQSTGSGDAGSITVSAVRLRMDSGAAISAEAETSTANGGNITLTLNDLLYLTNSKITTSVHGETGNGGNILIDPQLVVLNHSSIIAEAVEGHGGNITINAGAFIPSADSVVSASSQLGISGTVLITGPRVDVNGALIVLSSELRGRAAVMRQACAAYRERPVSSLVEAGRGGLPQDPETTLPALYIADRDLSPNPAAGSKTEANSAPLQTAVRLTMHCG
jgi:filamentous hemagglutinin family protein